MPETNETPAIASDRGKDCGTRVHPIFIQILSAMMPPVKPDFNFDRNREKNRIEIEEEGNG